MFQFLLEEAATTGGATSGGWITIVLVLAMFVLFYFFGIRPQRKQEKEAAAMRDALEVGDEITTIGGIIGEIVSMKEDTLVIETGSDRSKIRIARWAVAQNLTAMENSSK